MNIIDRYRKDDPYVVQARHFGAVLEVAVMVG